ncbi:hypothetical protein [uncultured Bartonella sp.]|nr:hypothetical protein [uncultured Bartonella sp.]
MCARLLLRLAIAARQSGGTPVNELRLLLKIDFYPLTKTNHLSF